MMTAEADRARSGDWDPALWSIGTVLAAAIIYLACLSWSISHIFAPARHRTHSKPDNGSRNVLESVPINCSLALMRSSNRRVFCCGA